MRAALGRERLYSGTCLMATAEISAQVRPDILSVRVQEMLSAPLSVQLLILLQLGEIGLQLGNRQVKIGREGLPLQLLAVSLEDFCRTRSEQNDLRRTLLMVGEVKQPPSDVDEFFVHYVRDR